MLTLILSEVRIMIGFRRTYVVPHRHSETSRNVFKVTLSYMLQNTRSLSAYIKVKTLLFTHTHTKKIEAHLQQARASKATCEVPDLEKPEAGAVFVTALTYIMLSAGPLSLPSL